MRILLPTLLMLVACETSHQTAPSAPVAPLQLTPSSTPVVERPLSPTELTDFQLRKVQVRLAAQDQAIDVLVQSSIKSINVRLRNATPTLSYRITIEITSMFYDNPYKDAFTSRLIAAYVNVGWASMEIQLLTGATLAVVILNTPQ